MEKKTSIKFTVIIPTRERADTLKYSLQTILNQSYENLEIIVSDNFSQDNTKEIVNGFKDPRLRYLNTGKRISMTQNFEFALSHVKEGWVTFLGDDDGLLPGALEKIEKVIKDTDCKAITTKPISYWWPNSYLDNYLRIPFAKGVEFRNSIEWLKKVFLGNASYTDLPCIYIFGFAEINLINAARASNGKFFMSLTPDLYSAVALALILREYVAFLEPVSIAGLSKHSNGDSFFGNSLNPEPKNNFFLENDIPFHPSLGSGKVKSHQLLTYETYLQAKHLHDPLNSFEISEQLALSIAKANPRDFIEVRDYCLEVARLNFINEKIVLKMASKLRSRFRRDKVLNLGKKIFSLLKSIEINCKPLGINNVLEASWFSHALYFQNVINPNWKIKSLWFGSIKKISNGISELIFFYKMKKK